MRHRLISLLLTFIVILGMIPSVASAASTPEEALGEVNIYSGGYSMKYLAVNGRVQTQSYTYFLYSNSAGEVQEIPAYCVTPNQYGVPQTVPEGESIEYLAEEKASDPKVVGLIANMYPHRSLEELGLDNKYQAFYAGKIALWCYLIPEWDIRSVTVAPGLTGSERAIGEKLLDAATRIYTQGMTWDHVDEPQITVTPDREQAYPITIDGEEYLQQIFTVTSDTWVVNHLIDVAFQSSSKVPVGTRITDMEGRDLTQLEVSNTGNGYSGQFKVLYPAASVEGQSGSVQLTLSADVYQYAVFYALCQEVDEYGNLQDYMNTLIEVTADDPETLEQRVTAVEKLCVASDMIARRCDYKQEQAFLSTLPLLSLDPDVERKSRRNALTSGVAAAFPFVSYELSDRNGIFLGLNLYNRSPVFLDPYDDYKYTNGNLWIGGTSGVGKSVTLQCLGGRIRQQGRRVIFIVPKKGHEFRPLCEKIGGLYLRLSPSSEDCPNLMAIRRKTLDSYAHLHNLKKRGDSVLAAKISSLLIWYSLQKKDMSDEDKNYLDTSLVECYRRYGITFENDSLVDENGDFKEMPILEDWYNVLQENAETRHLAVVLARYVTGSAAAMGKRNHIDLNNKYIVLDTTGMPADLMLSGIFWATEVANDIIMDFGAEQSALLADELWALAGATSNSHVAGFVLEMVKTIRGLGGIAVTSTQGMQDLFGLEGGKYGKGILDSSRLKIVMQMEEQEARLIQGVLNLSEDEVRQITRFRRGEGLLCFGYNHVPISIYVTPKEYEAITTSPTDRQAMLERRETDE